MFYFLGGGKGSGGCEAVETAQLIGRTMARVIETPSVAAGSVGRKRKGGEGRCGGEGGRRWGRRGRGGG